MESNPPEANHPNNDNYQDENCHCATNATRNVGDLDALRLKSRLAFRTGKVILK